MGYFKQLRRKIGVITLAVACVLTAGWFRSRTNIDGVGIGIAEKVYSCRGSEGNLYFQSFNRKDPSQFLIWGSIPLAAYASIMRVEEFGEYPVVCSAEPTGIRWIGNMQFGILPKQPNTRDVVVPYWSIVIPLTLLSAWLLLSMPRPKQPITLSFRG